MDINVISKMWSTIICNWLIRKILRMVSNFCNWIFIDNGISKI